MYWNQSGADCQPECQMGAVDDSEVLGVLTAEESLVGEAGSQRLTLFHVLVHHEPFELLADKPRIGERSALEVV